MPEEKVKQRIRGKRYRDKNRNNINYKLRLQISKSIRSALINNNSKKSGSILEFLPYSIDELKAYIESQFESWMSWDNWGRYSPKTWDNDNKFTWTWQLDHIIPASKFKYKNMTDNEFLKCWSLENLRPYSAKQNCIDGSTKIRH